MRLHRCRAHRSRRSTAGEGRDPAFERAIGRQAARAGNGCGRLFSAGGHPRGLHEPIAFASRSKIAGLRHPPLALRPSAVAPGAGPCRPPSVIATKAAMGAADPAKDLIP